MKIHFNVVLFSINHSSRKNYVVTRFSPPQGLKSQMVFVFFFGIRFEWPPNPKPINDDDNNGSKPPT